MERLDSKKIEAFLGGLTNTERKYLRSAMDISSGIRQLVNHYGMTKIEICNEFRITPRGYSKFIAGNHEYTMSHIATLQALTMKFAIEERAKDIKTKFITAKKGK